MESLVGSVTSSNECSKPCLLVDYSKTLAPPRRRRQTVLGVYHDPTHQLQQRKNRRHTTCSASTSSSERHRFPTERLTLGAIIGSTCTGTSSGASTDATGTGTKKEVTFCIKRSSSNASTSTSACISPCTGMEDTSASEASALDTYDDSMMDSTGSFGHSTSTRRGRGSSRGMGMGMGMMDSSIHSTSAVPTSSSRREDLKRTLALRKTQSLRSVGMGMGMATSTELTSLSPILRAPSKANIVRRTSQRGFHKTTTSTSMPQKEKQKCMQQMEAMFHQGCSDLKTASRTATNTRRGSSNRSLLKDESSHRRRSTRKSASSKSLIALGEAPMTLLLSASYHNQRQRQLSEQQTPRKSSSMRDLHNKSRSRRQTSKRRSSKNDPNGNDPSEFAALEALLMGQQKLETRRPDFARTPSEGSFGHHEHNAHGDNSKRENSMVHPKPKKKRPPTTRRVPMGMY